MQIKNTMSYQFIDITKAVMKKEEKETLPVLVRGRETGALRHRWRCGRPCSPHGRHNVSCSKVKFYRVGEMAQQRTQIQFLVPSWQPTYISRGPGTLSWPPQGQGTYIVHRQTYRQHSPPPQKLNKRRPRLIAWSSNDALLYKPNNVKQGLQWLLVCQPPSPAASFTKAKRQE